MRATRPLRAVGCLVSGITLCLTVSAYAASKKAEALPSTSSAKISKSQQESNKTLPKTGSTGVGKDQKTASSSARVSADQSTGAGKSAGKTAGSTTTRTGKLDKAPKETSGKLPRVRAQEASDTTPAEPKIHDLPARISKPSGGSAETSAGTPADSAPDSGKADLKDAPAGGKTPDYKDRLRGKVTPEDWKEFGRSGRKGALTAVIRRTFDVPEDVEVSSPAEALDFVAGAQKIRGEVSSKDWKNYADKGKDEALTGMIRDTFHIPDDVPIESPGQALDFAGDAQKLGGDVTEADWRAFGAGRGEEALKDMAKEALGIGDDAGLNLKELLEGASTGTMIGVEKITPEFLKDWQRTKQGGLTLDELLDIWVPGAKPGDGEGTVPQLGEDKTDGVPGGTSREDVGGWVRGRGGPSDDRSRTTPGGPGAGGGEGTGGGAGGGVAHPGVDTAGTGTGGLPGTEGGAGSGGAAQGAAGGGDIASATGTPSPQGQTGAGETPGGAGLGAPGTDTGVAGGPAAEGADSGVFGRFTSDGEGGFNFAVYGVDQDGNLVNMGTEHFSPQGDGTWVSDQSGDVLQDEPATGGSYTYETTEDGEDVLGYSPDEPDEEGDPDEAGDTEDDTGETDEQDTGETDDDDTTAEGEEDTGGGEDTGGTDDSAGGEGDDTAGTDTADADTTDDTDDAGMPNPMNEGRAANPERSDRGGRDAIAQPAPGGGSARAVMQMSVSDAVKGAMKRRLDPLIHTTGEEGGDDEEQPPPVVTDPQGAISQPAPGTEGQVDAGQAPALPPRENPDPHGGGHDM